MYRLFYLCLAILSLISSNIHADNPLPIIHVIGDSHSMEFVTIPGCLVHMVGPATMHRVGRDGLEFLCLSNFDVKEGDSVVFAFGEIDVRKHIGIQRDFFHRELDEVLNTLVNHYIYTILVNRLLYQNLTCIIYSITPPTQTFDPVLFGYGTLADRVNITKRLNAKLAILCSQFGIPFLDVYENYANSDGTLNTALSDGNIHINPVYNQPIHQKLFKILGKGL